MKVRLFYQDPTSGERRPLDTSAEVSFSVKRTNNIFSDKDLELERTTEITLPHTLRNDREFATILSPNAEWLLPFEFRDLSIWRQRIPGGIEIDGVSHDCYIIVSDVTEAGYKTCIIFGEYLPLASVIDKEVKDSISNPDGRYEYNYLFSGDKRRARMQDYGPLTAKPNGYSNYYKRGGGPGKHNSLDLMWALAQLSNEGFTVTGWPGKPILLSVNYKERIRDDYHAANSIANRVGLQNTLSQTPITFAYGTQRTASGAKWTGLYHFAAGQTVSFYSYTPTTLVLVAATPPDTVIPADFNDWDSIRFVGSTQAVINKQTGEVTIEGPELCEGEAIYIDEPCIPVSIDRLRESAWQDGQGEWHFGGYDANRIATGDLHIMSTIEDITEIWYRWGKSITGQRRHIAPDGMTYRDVINIYRLFGGVALRVNGLEISLVSASNAFTGRVVKLTPKKAVQTRKGFALANAQNVRSGAEMTKASTQSHEHIDPTLSPSGDQVSDYFFTSSYGVADRGTNNTPFLNDITADGEPIADKWTILKGNELFDPLTPSKTVTPIVVQPEPLLLQASRVALNPLTVATAVVDMSYFDYNDITEETRINIEGCVYAWVESTWNAGTATFTLQSV